MKARTLTAAIGLALVLSGCASLEPKPGFDEVRSEAAGRLGKTIHWRQGGAEDEEVVASVRRMLESEVGADEAVQITLLANPRLQSVYEELGIAQADLVQAGLLRNPVFGAVALRTRDGEHTNLDFDIAWDFLGVFTLPLRKRAAEYDFEEAKLRVTAEVMDLAAEVRTAFYQAQANEQAVEMLQQVVTATDAALHAAERLREAGNISELALDQRRAIHHESRLMLAGAEAARDAARERLNGMMGLWGSATQWRMARRLPEAPREAFDVSRIEGRAVERSLDLATLRLRMEALARRVGITDVTSVIPDLEISYAWERDDGEWSDGPGLEIPIPIFDFGQARRARIRSQLQQLRAQYKTTAIRLRSAARNAARGLQLARARERHLREVLLPLRERITYGMQLEYNAMQVGVFRLLQSQEQQILTARRYVQALQGYWLARARVEQIVNGRMGAATDGGMAMAAGTAPMPADADAGGH